MDKEKHSLYFEPNPVLAITIRFIVCIVAGAGIGIFAVAYGARYMEREDVLFMLPLAAVLGALGGFVIGWASGMFRRDWFKEAGRWWVTQPPSPSIDAKIREIDGKFSVHDRTFENRKDAEAYKLFVDSYLSDWRAGFERRKPSN